MTVHTTSPGASPGAASYSRKATGLVREVSLLEMVAYNGSVALPTGLALAISIFFVYASFPGANLIVALLIGLVLVPWVWVTFSLMSAALPRTGGDYIFCSRVIGPVWGLFSNAAVYVGTLLGVGLSAYLLTQVGLGPVFATIGYVTGNHWWVNASATITEPGWTFVAATVIIVAISVLSVAGTKVVAKTMAYLYAIALIGTVVATIILLFTSRHGFAQSINEFAKPYTGHPDTYTDTIDAGAKAGLQYPSESGYSLKQTIGAIFPASAVMYATFYGVYLAGEMKGAGQRRRQLTAIAGGGYFQAILLILCVVIFLKTVGTDFIIAASSGNFPVGVAPYYPFFASVAAHSSIVAILLGITFVCAVPPLVYGNLAMCQRAPFALAFDGLIPSRVAAVSPRTHTPNVAIAIAATFSIALAYWASHSSSFTQVLAYASVIGVLAFVTVGVAAAVMPWRRPEIYYGSAAEWRVGKIHVLPVAGVGCALVGLFLYGIVFYFHGQLGVSHPWILVAILVGCLVFAIILYPVARAVQRRRGVNLDLVYKTLPAE